MKLGVKTSEYTEQARDEVEGERKRGYTMMYASCHGACQNFHWNTKMLMCVLSMYS